MNSKTFSDLFFKYACAAALACNTALAPSASMAATQGTQGTTSTGTMVISVTKPVRASIRGMSDLTAGNWVLGQGDRVLTTNVCVYSTRPTGGYTVRARGSGASFAYRLANGSNFVTYTVRWNSGGVNNLADTGTALTTNVTSAQFLNAARDSSTCNGAVPGPTARLIVTISGASLTSVVNGTYTGTLTLLVTPN